MEFDHQRELGIWFEEMKSRWLTETALSSSGTEMVSNANYRAIIALGWDVIPIILDDLQKSPEWWFVALSEITGEQATNGDHRGDLEAMSRDWIKWGRIKGMTKQKSVTPGKYRHFKGGEYRVLGVAKNSENLDELWVVYHPLYETEGEVKTNIRPLGMFTEEIERNGVRMKRFELIEELPGIEELID